MWGARRWKSASWRWRCCWHRPMFLLDEWISVVTFFLRLAGADMDEMDWQQNPHERSCVVIRAATECLMHSEPGDFWNHDSEMLKAAVRVWTGPQHDNESKRPFAYFGWYTSALHCWRMRWGASTCPHLKFRRRCKFNHHSYKSHRLFIHICLVVSRTSWPTWMPLGFLVTMLCQP